MSHGTRWRARDYLSWAGGIVSGLVLARTAVSAAGPTARAGPAEVLSASVHKFTNVFRRGYAAAGKAARLPVVIFWSNVVRSRRVKVHSNGCARLS